MEELCEGDRELVNRAIDATSNSYSRYSHFSVGAALRLSGGGIVIGANQENAAFPSSLCAERTAVFSAQANYPSEAITALAIAARNADGLTHRPVTPCGACRQVLIEMEDRYKCHMRILLYGTDEIYVVEKVEDLLPLYFVDANMND